MKAYPFRLAFAAAALTATAAAQEPAPASPAPVAAAPNPPSAMAAAPAPAAASAGPAAAPDAPAPPRLISGALAASLAAGLPKYTPPPPVEEKKPVEDADANDPDKPKNQVFRLASVIVRGERTPVFRERDLNGTKNQIAIAMDRYPGLKIPLIGFLNSGVALEMYRQDQRLDDISELKADAAAARRGGDAAGSEYIMRASAETFGITSALAPTPDDK
jgi:hypothetical protein